MDKLCEICPDQEKGDAMMCPCATYCVLLGTSSICIGTVDTHVLVLSFYYYAHVNNDFLTLNFPFYISILRKSENLLNESNADY